MDDHNPDPGARQPNNDGWRTPVIEDDNHPLNLWRTQQLEIQGNGLESHFSAHNGLAKEQFDRFQKARKPILKRPTSWHFHPVHEEHLPWRERVKHTSWAWFTMCMATGGLANTLHTGMLFAGFFGYATMIVKPESKSASKLY